MRRTLLWMAAALLVLGMGMMALCRLHPAHNTASCRMNRSQAALRSGERMPFDWPNGSIDPNTADAETLALLPNVGPVVAQSIIEEREKNGPFVYPEDLVSVRGIGVKTMRKMWKHMLLPQITNEQE